jgi:apolipoprotein D and lipocalin family protein
MRKLLSRLFTIAVVVTLAGCVVAIPNGITPVTNFDTQRYLGD